MTPLPCYILKQINDLSRFNSHWGWSLVIGILDIICGVWLLCLPEPALMAATTVWLLLGFSLVCFGLYRIILSFQVKKVDRFFEG